MALSRLNRQRHQRPLGKSSFGAAWQIQSKTTENELDALMSKGMVLQLQALEDLSEAGLWRPVEHQLNLCHHCRIPRPSIGGLPVKR